MTLCDLASSRPADFLARALQLLGDKGQVVFYGPPGTGKTYVARKLAGYIARGGGTVERYSSTLHTPTRTSSRDTGPAWWAGK